MLLFYTFAAIAAVAAQSSSSSPSSSSSSSSSASATSTAWDAGVPTDLPVPGNYSGDLRPQIHFSPPTKFMNDPNGCFQDGDGLWHLYYQCKALRLLERERNGWLMVLFRQSYRHSCRKSALGTCDVERSLSLGESKNRHLS